MAANAPRLSFAGGTLLLEGFDGRGRPVLGGQAEWIWDDRVHGWRCDALAYPALRTDPLFIASRIVDQVASWRRIACANNGATVITEMFSGNGSRGISIVSVMNIRLMTLLPIRSAAPFDSTPCVTAA